MDIIKDSKSTTKTNYSPYVFKLDVEGDIKEYKLEKGIAKSKVSGYSLGDTVIARRTYTISAMEIMGLNEDRLKKSKPSDIEVVSVGPEVKDIEVGDIVELGYSPTSNLIDFKDNPRTIVKTVAHFENIDKIPSDKRFNKVTMVEYVTVNAHSVKHVFKIA